jgi:hypothetical protein
MSNELLWISEIDHFQLGSSKELGNSGAESPNRGIVLEGKAHLLFFAISSSAFHPRFQGGKMQVDGVQSFGYHFLPETGNKLERVTTGFQGNLFTGGNLLRYPRGKAATILAFAKSITPGVTDGNWTQAIFRSPLQCGSKLFSTVGSDDL